LIAAEHPYLTAVCSVLIVALVLMLGLFFWEHRPVDFDVVRTIDARST